MRGSVCVCSRGRPKRLAIQIERLSGAARVQQHHVDLLQSMAATSYMPVGASTAGSSDLDGSSGVLSGMNLVNASLGGGYHTSPSPRSARA